MFLLLLLKPSTTKNSSCDQRQKKRKKEKASSNLYIPQKAKILEIKLNSGETSLNAPRSYQVRNETMQWGSAVSRMKEKRRLHRIPSLMHFPTSLEGVHYRSQGTLHLLVYHKTWVSSERDEHWSQKWSVYHYFQNIFRLVKHLLISGTMITGPRCISF